MVYDFCLPDDYKKPLRLTPGRYQKKNGASINGPIKNVSLYFICYLHITTLYKKMKYIFTCIHIRKIVIAINGVRPSVSCFADVSPSLTVFGHNRYQRAVLGPGKACVG